MCGLRKMIHSCREELVYFAAKGTLKSVMTLPQGDKNTFYAKNTILQSLKNSIFYQILLSYNFKDASDVKVTLTDLTGRVVNSAKLGRQTAGATTYNMNVDAAAGLYFVQLNINGQIATQKVVIK